MYKQFNILFLGIALLLFGCKEELKEQPQVNWTKENSTKMGEEMAIREELDIKVFIASHPDYQFEMTGTGLRIDIYEHSEKGDSLVPGDVVDIEYQIKLLDGTICYGTDEDEVEEVVVDRSEIETGVQEALKLLKEGDKARLIIPSHIAHGLIGDRDKIPPLTVLFLDIKVDQKVK